jgi:hypothetical protein
MVYLVPVPQRHGVAGIRTTWCQFAKLWLLSDSLLHMRQIGRPVRGSSAYLEPFSEPHELPRLAHDVHRHALQPPPARVGDVVLLLDGPLPRPHPEVRRKDEVIAWELDKLPVLKEHELGVKLQYDPDGGPPYVTEAEK